MSARTALLRECLQGMMRWQDRFDRVEEKDAAWMCERLRWHKLMPLAASLHDPARPKCPTLTRAFEGMLLENLAREERYFRQAQEVLGLLEAEGLSCQPYKGPFWGGQVFPRYSWRHVGDIDLMMGVDAARAASQLLKRLGYRPEVLGETEEDDFRNRGELTCHPDAAMTNLVPVQLHWHVMPSPRFLRKRFMTAEDFVAGSSAGQWRSIRFPLPRAEVRMLYYLLHATCQHQFNRFVLISDMALFIDQHPGLDWGALVRMAGERRCLVPLHYGLSFLAAFGGLPREAFELIASTRPAPRVRLLAAWLTPRAVLHADARRGRTRRQLFRIAMSA